MSVLSLGVLETYSRVVVVALRVINALYIIYGSILMIMIPPLGVCCAVDCTVYMIVYCLSAYAWLTNFVHIFLNFSKFFDWSLAVVNGNNRH